MSKENDLTFGKTFKYGAIAIALLGGLAIVSTGVGFLTESATVAKEQFGHEPC